MQSKHFSDDWDFVHFPARDGIIPPTINGEVPRLVGSVGAEVEAEVVTAEMNVAAFLSALAAREPAPGGGGAAALTVAQAAALVCMTANFTLGNRRYVEAEAEMRQILAAATTLQATALALADADAAAFSAVAETFSMPGHTADERAVRSARRQRALEGATRAPFAIARCALDVMALIEPVAARGNPNVVSDAGTALYLSISGFRSALLNVRVNLGAIRDEYFVAGWSGRVDRLLAEEERTRRESMASLGATLGVPL